MTSDATGKTAERWTWRALTWQTVAALSATVAEYAMRLTLWAQDRSKASR